MTEQDVRQPAAAGESPTYPTSGTVGASRRRRTMRRTGGRHLPRWEKAALIGGAAGLIVLGGVGMSMQSPMHISEVVIVGASADLQPQVASAVGAAPGQSFASVDVGAAEERVLAIEGIEHADLHWSWWNTLSVDVVERTPVGLLAEAAGGFLVLDASGETIRTAPQRPAAMVLIESDGTGGRAAALQVAQALPADLRAATDAVIASGSQSVSLRMASGATVELGTTEDLPEKFLLASQLLAGTGATTVNVTVPERPAVAGVPDPPKP